MLKSIVFVALCLAVASGTVYFQEKFDDGWEDRWVKSDWKASSGQAGKWEVTAGDWYGDAEEDKGLRTTQDARFYAISSKIQEEFSSVGKPLVLQFSVKHAQNIDCGGGYIKIFPDSLNQEKLEGDSDYNIMFGPDICGTGTKRIHAIFNYKGENLLIKKTVNCETDQLTHVYTLIVNPDLTYEIRVDGDKRESGNLADDWDFLAPKEIKDPEQSKPADWVDEAKIDDPEDVKPEGYDDIPKMIPDPEAEKPSDWDDEDDGEWDPPMLENPEWKGEWKPRKIDNPDYEGPWVHPMIANPDYEEDNTIGQFESNAYVGFDLWQVKAGSIFDNIIVTDDVEEAEDFMKATWTKNKDGEKKMFDKAEADRKAEEEEARRKAEEEMAALEDEEDDYDDYLDDEDEEDDYSHDEL